LLAIYGSSRLGGYKVQGDSLANDQNKLTLGRREYELVNHLGNVLATVSDVKLPAARVLSHTDYYAFGGAMPGRSGGSYRYGFNTQEKSPELAPDHYTAEFWEYDARIGRRWNLDPVDQISISNYAVNRNNPIAHYDPKGDCATCITGALIEAMLDLTFQVGEHMMAGDDFKTALSKVDWGSVTISAGMGAVTSWADGGVGKLVKAVSNRRKREVLEFVIGEAMGLLLEQAEGAIREHIDSDFTASMAYDAFASVNQDLGFKLLPEGKPKEDVSNPIGKIGQEAAVEKMKELYPDATIVTEITASFDDGSTTRFDIVVLERGTNKVIAVAESKATANEKSKASCSAGQRRFYANGESVTFKGPNAKRARLNGVQINKDQVKTFKVVTTSAGKPGQKTHDPKPSRMRKKVKK
jgi:RHS repeat-associated protein